MNASATVGEKGAFCHCKLIDTYASQRIDLHRVFGLFKLANGRHSLKCGCRTFVSLNTTKKGFPLGWAHIKR